MTCLIALVFVLFAMLSTLQYFDYFPGGHIIICLLYEDFPGTSDVYLMMYTIIRAYKDNGKHYHGYYYHRYSNAKVCLIVLHNYSSYIGTTSPCFKVYIGTTSLSVDSFIRYQTQYSMSVSVCWSVVLVSVGRSVCLDTNLITL